MLQLHNDAVGCSRYITTFRTGWVGGVGWVDCVWGNLQLRNYIPNCVLAGYK